MTSLTVRDVLAMDVLRAASPEVIAGAEGLDRSIRWVHSTELADIAGLLRGGDLILSTGIALPDSDAELARFAASLHEVDAAGLAIELGRRWNSVPRALADSCAQHALPLIALHREVRFATVAQAVGERIVDDQIHELRETQRIHEVFTELSIAEAPPREILAAVQRLAGGTVVLEDQHHHVVDYQSERPDASSVLDNWTDRSRRVNCPTRTGWDAGEGWLATVVGRPERGWGRLMVQSRHAPSSSLIAIAERGAAALAMHRLNDRDRTSQIRRTHHELLVALLSEASDADLLRRCGLIGLPARGRFTGLTIRPVPNPSGMATIDDIIATTISAARRNADLAVAAQVDGAIRVLLSHPPTAGTGVAALGAAIQGRHRVVIGAGRPVESLTEANKTLRESWHVAAAVPERDPAVAVHRLADVHVRGLLTLLHDDDRLRLFTERELAPLGEHPELLASLSALLEHPTSKSRAAQSCHLSRPAFYDRMAKIERLIGRSLDDPETRLSLHTALLSARLAQQA